MIFMNKTKNKMAERIVNHALEIIYLVTGEEYTIVKKSSPQSRIHKMTGEVPIKCDDVAVYFSMEEWEYIEGHKELYKDVMMEDHQALRIVGFPDNESPGLYAVNLNTEQIGVEGKYESQENNILEAETKSDPCTGGRGTPSPALDHSWNRSNDPPGLYAVNQIPEQIGVEGKYESQGNNILEAETKSDPCTGIHAVNLNIEQTGEEGNDEIEENNFLEAEIKLDPCADRFMSENILDESHTAACSEDIVEEDTHLSHRCQGNYSKESTLYETKILFFPKVSSRCEQMADALNQVFVKDCTDLPFRRRRASQMVTYEDRKTTTSDKHQEPFILNSISTHQVSCDRTLTESKKCIGPDSEKLCSVKAHICLQCGKVFSCRSKLTVHLGSHKGKSVCEKCGKSFTKSSDLARHLKAHIGENHHVCQQCGKDFPCRTELRIHWKSHTRERSYTCEKCGRSYLQQSDLVRHQKTHTGKKPYVCQQCGKGFFQKSDLGRHERTHTGEKPFICQICGRGFSDKSNLVAHNRTHTGEKPYICQICGRGFSNKTRLNKHQSTHLGH